MLLEPVKAKKVVLTTVYLHNFLRKKSCSQQVYTPQGSFDIEVDGKIIPATWRHDGEQSSLLPIRNVPRRGGTYAKEIVGTLLDILLQMEQYLGSIIIKL